MWENLMDLAAQAPVKPANGLPGLLVGLIGGSVTIAQAIQRWDMNTFFAIVIGTSAGVGGIGWQIYCSGLNAAMKECQRLRQRIDQIQEDNEKDFKDYQKSSMEALRDAEKERTALFRLNSALEGELARLKAEFRPQTQIPE